MWRPAVLVFLVLLGGCQGGARVPEETRDVDAVVHDVQLARGYGDDTAIDPTDVFRPDDEAIYAVVKVSNPTRDAVELRATWIAVDAGGEEVEIVSHEEIIRRRREGTVGFKFTVREEAFPVGRYAVKVYVDDELRETAEFTVEEEPSVTLTPRP